MPSFWPGVDKWPPPRWVWIAAALMTLAAPLLIYLLGGVGVVIIAVVVAVGLFLGANARLRNIGAEDFWESRPKD